MPLGTTLGLKSLLAIGVSALAGFGAAEASASGPCGPSGGRSVVIVERSSPVVIVDSHHSHRHHLASRGDRYRHVHTPARHSYRHHSHHHHHAPHHVGSSVGASISIGGGSTHVVIGSSTHDVGHYRASAECYTPPSRSYHRGSGRVYERTYERHYERGYDSGRSVSRRTYTRGYRLVTSCNTRSTHNSTVYSFNHYRR